MGAYPSLSSKSSNLSMFFCVIRMYPFTSWNGWRLSPHFGTQELLLHLRFWWLNIAGHAGGNLTKMCFCYHLYINVKYEVSEDVLVYFDEKPHAKYCFFLVADRFFSWYCGGYFWTSA